MANFLFWNLQKKPLGESIYRLAVKHEVDVLMLAECTLSPNAVLETLNRENADYFFPFSEREKIRVFTRFKGDLLEARSEAPRWTIRQLLLPGLDDVLLVIVHLQSKLYWSDASQTAQCYELAQAIQQTEKEVGHKRTVVVGDFNMNPFEFGMIAANGMHGEMTRQISSRGSRIVDEQEHTYFYNPMWNFFGDATRGPAGTFHHDSAEMVKISWNILDQVLIRPALLSRFNTDDLEILTSDGERSFLKPQSGTPGANGTSDHLPVLFKLKP